MHNSQPLPAPISQRLLSVWKDRYVARVESTSTGADSFSPYALELTASDTGRRRILEKLSDKLIKDASRSAAARTRRLHLQHEYLKFENTVDFSRFTLQTIPILLEHYQKYPPLTSTSTQTDSKESTSPKSQFGIANIVDLTKRLEACFLEFKAQHATSANWLEQYFLTSQISLTCTSLLTALDAVEQAMVKPYFDLLEEYVSIPWWRLCKAASEYTQAALQYQLVERMLRQTTDISFAVHTRWSQQFAQYASARGGLNTLKIKRSSLRDFAMFQVYLWLCVFQQNLDAIENELVVFCDYVYKGLGIPHQMTIAGSYLLREELLNRLTVQEKALTLDFLDGMVRRLETISPA